MIFFSGKCPNCSANFSLRCSLNRHIRQGCEAPVQKISANTCEICGKILKVQLKKHMETVHNVYSPPTKQINVEDFKQFPEVPAMPIKENFKEPKLTWREIFIHCLKQHGGSATVQEFVEFAMSHFKYFETCFDKNQLWKV